MHFPPRFTAAVFCCFAIVLATSAHAAGITVNDLNRSKIYRVDQIIITGNREFSSEELLAVMRTKQRPVYMLWKKRPVFDPDDFTTDIKVLRRFYEMHGYYRASVDYDLKLNGDLVTAIIRIKENKPVITGRVQVELDGRKIELNRPPYNALTLKAGDIFTEDAYRKSQQSIREFFLNSGYAHVKVRREAQVNVTADRARVWYFVRPGVATVFGKTTVVGEKTVSPNVILRELTYKPGQKFSQAQIEDSRERLLKLGLFAVIRFNPQLKTDNPRVVPIELVVRERPRHQIAIGGGYNTESQFVAHFQWSDRNFLGDGRQLSAMLGYSNINSTAAITFMQPYLFGKRAFTGVLNLRQDVQQVPPYTLFGSRVLPHLEYAVTHNLTVTFGYRLEYADLTSVDSTVISRLGGLRLSGVLSGPRATLTLNTTENPYNPEHGYVLTVDLSQAGGIFGGKYDYYRGFVQAKHYMLIGWGTILATRLKIGTGDSLGAKNEYPLFERFYAGGEGSVRGYGYWLLGPKSSDNVPLGGLSDIEGSFELRHHIWDKLSGAIFLDFGQLSLHPYDLPVSNLRFAAGPALMYTTPLGPMRIDIGFPFKKPRGEPSWQVYFSIGQFF